MSIRIILVYIFFMGSAHANFDEFENLFGQLLERYWQPAVRINGINTTVFDYSQMKMDADQPQSIFNQTLKAISGVDPSQLTTPNEKKAFWINVYNFAAIRLVIDHYPVDSIRSLHISLVKYPWTKKVIQIGSKEYSLKQIEKDLLLKNFDDPRIVFAVSCAAVSCPDRTPEPFIAAKLDQQLDKMIRDFFTNPHKGLLLNPDNNTLTLSWILKKDKDLFENKKGGVIGFISPYVSEEIRAWLNVNSVNIAYFDHDWTLNDLAQAKNNI